LQEILSNLSSSAARIHKKQYGFRALLLPAEPSMSMSTDMTTHLGGRSGAQVQNFSTAAPRRRVHNGAAAAATLAPNAGALAPAENGETLLSSSCSCVASGSSWWQSCLRPHALAAGLRLAWARCIQRVAGFFAGEGSDDPLVEVVVRYPEAAPKFIGWVMLFSGLGSLLVLFASALFLQNYWERCAHCSRPLRWWLLFHAGLQAALAPVRLIFFVKLRRAEEAVNTTGGVDRDQHHRSSDVAFLEGPVGACVASFTGSAAWKASKTLSLVSYGWLILGVVWLINGGECPMCPGMPRMILAVILQAVARAMVALACFKALFSQPEPESSSPNAPQAASEEQIASLPVVRFTPELFAEPGAGCAVCLSDYEPGDRLRQLPCGHYFHCACADRWLGRSCRCPLCMQEIGASHLAAGKEA
jgi:hypothetical protein